MSSRPSTFALSSPGRLRVYATHELLAMPKPTWLVDKIIPNNGFVGLYGQPGSYKSFVAIDIALCVATGKPWHGHVVNKQFVVYVSAEGGGGIGKRANAWLSHYGYTPKQTDIGWILENLMINNDMSVNGDIAVLFERLYEEVWKTPSLVVIDTLARCFEGNENEQEDMNRFVAGIDVLRKEFKASVVIVHHTRKAGDAERGNSAFRGAADTMMLCQKPDPDEPQMVFSCSKQKDDDPFETMNLEFMKVGATESGVVVESGVSSQMRVFRAISEKPDATAALVKRLMLSRATIKRACHELVEKGEITKQNDKYTIQVAHAKRL